MNETSRKTVRVVRLRRKFLYILIGTFLYITGLVLICTSYNRKLDVPELLYAYNIKQKPLYNVSIYNNSYIDSNVIGENQTYISDLVKTINTDFKYTYNASKKADELRYTYSVKANINGNYKLEDEKSKVWNKEYTLVNEKTNFLNNTNSFTINESVPVDYKYFDNIVSNFRNDLKISIDSTLTVKLVVNVNGLIDNERINDTRVQSITFPLNQKAFKINKDYQETDNKSIVKQIPRSKVYSIPKLIIGTMFIIIAIAINMKTYLSLFGFEKKSEYTLKLNKILKEYGEVIVEVNNRVNKKGLEVIDVKSFDEMIDLEEELRIPIMFHETYKNKRGEFTLIHQNIMYRFVLKEA